MAEVFADALDPERQDEILRHAEICPDCAERAEELELLAETLRDLGTLEGEGEESVPRAVRPLPWLPLAAAGLVGAFILGWSLRPAPVEPREADSPGQETRAEEPPPVTDLPEGFRHLDAVWAERSPLEIEILVAHFGEPLRAGVVLTHALPAGAAASIGLEPFDIVTAVDGAPVVRLEDIRKLSSKSEIVLFRKGREVRLPSGSR